jgi:DNA polymerase III subunit delta'
VPLSSLIGHRQLIALLRTAVARERVPQSLLFAGPEGVGKREAAIALAQAVNCPNRGSGQDDACGRCPTCQRIARGQHTDVQLIDRGDEASIKIRKVRERLLDLAGYRPFEARRRVFIIDPADELTTEAQDALLKTLEEPATSTMIILISAYADTLLPTIQSRCRRLRFAPLSDADVSRVLTERCEIEPARARLMAAASGGSVRRALDEEAGDIAEDREAAVALLQASVRREVMPRLKAAEALAKHGSKRRDREALADRLALVASLCRDVAALQAGARHVISSSDLTDVLSDLGRTFTPQRLAGAFATLQRAQQALERNASPKIVADWVGTRL